MPNYFVFAILFSALTLLISIYWNSFVWEINTFNLGYEKYNQEPLNKNSDMKKMLFVGITSSPDHFRQRQSLRETWLKLLPDMYIYSFVVGDQACSIHPLYRKSPYSCESLDFSIPENTTENSIFHANSANLPENCDSEFQDNVGFRFLVHHPIVIQFLGIKKSKQILNRYILVKVVLIDASTLDKITSVTFHCDSLLEDSSEKDYIFKKVKNPVILPKGFEGIVKVEGPSNDTHEESYKDYVDWTRGQFFSVLSTIRPTKLPGSTQTANNYCGWSTFRFMIKDLDKLNSYIREKQSRLLEWSRHVEGTRKQLQREAELYKDIIFLNIVDVYRNLPKKVLLLIQWVHNNSRVKYVLKTDDDTFIDIKRVEVELDSTSGWDWWSCFRVGWPVQRHGKWRETAYQGEVYPAFPSGAGYILSEHALAWLSDRVENLTTNYQGEDVAIGIWLEGMNASRHVGSECYWACNKQCHSRTCNAMELSVDGIYKMWKDYKKCGNTICICPDPF